MMVRFGILEYVTEKGKEEGENVLDSKRFHSHPIRRENSSCALELKRVCGRLSGEISLRICRFKEQFFLCVV